MSNATEKRREWTLPGWPWELELLALIFVLMALILPLYLHSQPAHAAQAAATELNPAKAALAEQSGLLWSVAIAGLYFVHLLVARGSIALLSTPLTHLFAPLVFAGLAYYRIYVTTKARGESFAMATGATGQMVLFGLVVVVITLILARLQMARYLMTLRDEKWEVTSRARFDHSYPQMMAQLKPLIYVPRVYRASDQGILVEGWFYVMAIPYKLVQSIGPVAQFSLATPGEYFTTSGSSMMRLELRESNLPLFISPSNREEFLKYCTQHVVRLQRGTATGTSSGASAAGHGRTQRISMGQTQRLAPAEPASTSTASKT